MKKFYILLIGFVFVTTLCAYGQKGKFSLKGDMVYFLNIFGEGTSVDSVYLDINTSKDEWSSTGYKVIDNRLDLKGKIDKPYLAALTIKLNTANGKQVSYLPFILEKGNMVLNKNGWNEGTPQNDALSALMEANSRAMDKDNALDIIYSNVSEFSRKAENLFGFVIWLSSASRYMHPDKILELIDNAHPDIKADYNVKDKGAQIVFYSLLLKAAERQQKEFKDFTVEYAGKQQKFSDYVGNGKYMLVDFWASWCIPCRKEIPGLIAVYNKYKGDNFGVLGVAVNDDPKGSEWVIDEYGIPYPQILNAGEEVSQLYHINSIPLIILFAPDGTVVARGLRGEQIEEAVKKALKK